MNDRIKIKVGNREFDGLHLSNPEDSYLYCIDAVADNRVGSGQLFYTTYLSGVTAASFPGNLELSLSCLRTDFDKSEILWVRKSNCECIITLLLCFDFNKWDMPESLGFFVDRFSKKVEIVKNVKAVSVDKNEYGYNLYCSLSIADTEDIYTKFCNLENELESLYRNNIIQEKKEENKYGEERWHWWIRYVFVPLAGSGAVAAVLAYFFSK